MSRLTAAFALGLITVFVGSAAGKARYNHWAKEKVRFLWERVQRDPDNAQLRVLLGHAYYEDGKYAKAERHLNHALSVRPNYAEAHCNLAVILHASGRLGEAQRRYEAALGLDSSLVEAMAGLGTLLCDSERQGTGIKYLERVLQLDHGLVGARFNLAVAYHKVGDFRMAIRHLEILAAEPVRYPGVERALGQAYFSRGLTLLQAKRADGALGLFNKALEYSGDDEDLHFAAGIAHLRLDDLDNAEVAFATAVELDARHVPALHNLATVYERTNRTSEALVYYERVQELAPHFNDIEAARNAECDEQYLLE